MRRSVLRPVTLAVTLVAAPVAAQAPADPVAATGRSDPSFSQPSLAAGVDYTLPTEAEVVWPEGTAKLYRPLFHKITADVLPATVKGDKLTVVGIPAEAVASVWATAVSELLAFRRTEEYKALGIKDRQATAEFQVKWHAEYLIRELKAL